MSLLIKNIGQLVTLQGVSKKKGIRPKEEDLSIIKDAALLIEKDKIAWIGKGAKKFPKKMRCLDAQGMVILPGLIDPHTHLIFSGDRAHEFSMRAQGKSYLEITKEGGGILSTVLETRKASLATLVEAGMARLKTAKTLGITTLEIKSGYGLSLDSELKILKAITILQKKQPLRLVPTFLGAHAFPDEYKENTASYVHTLCSKWLPMISKQKLALFCDVFIDEGFFSLSQTEEIFNHAKKLGLGLRIHSDEFVPLGGTELAVQMEAQSCDHLMAITDRGIDALAESKTVATLLPATSFFLGKSFAPARKLIDRGACVALGTDFNPGSSMTQSLLWAALIAVTQMKLTISEALSAITFNAARSLALEEKLGSIEVGKIADLAFFDVPSYEHLIYHFGENFCKKTICSGIPA